MQRVPIIGGTIDTILSVEGMRARSERVWAFLEEVAEELRDVKDEQVDKEFIESPEFEGVLERIVRRSTTTSREEKLAMLRQALVGAITTDFAGDPLLDSFLQAVDVLSPEHIEVLIAIHKAPFTRMALGTSSPKYPFDEEVSIGDLLTMTEHFPIVSHRSFRDLLHDLIGRGFVEYVPNEGSALRQSRSDAYRATRLGKRFLALLAAGNGRDESEQGRRNSGNGR